MAQLTDRWFRASRCRSSGTGTCLQLTGFRSGSQEVLSCVIETPDLLGLGLGSPALFGCFVISDGKVLRGGSAMKAVAGCKAIRYDARTHGLIDVETGRHYPIETT
jgi:hypothetical protein